MALGDGITADLYIELGSIPKILCIRSLKAAILAPRVYFRRESQRCNGSEFRRPKAATFDEFDSVWSGVCAVMDTTC